MTAQHTPGPWAEYRWVEGDAQGNEMTCIDGGFEDTECIAVIDMRRLQWQANARLIAAAPLMLERLERNATALALAAEVMRAKGLDGVAASLELDASRTRDAIRAATGEDA